MLPQMAYPLTHTKYKYNSHTEFYKALILCLQLYYVPIIVCNKVIRFVIIKNIIVYKSLGKIAPPGGMTALCVCVTMLPSTA